MPRRLIATFLGTASVLLALCASAYALGVQVQAPGTSITVAPDGNVSVTAPGTQVNAGPGGVNLTVDPNAALGSLPGGSTPSAPTAPAQDGSQSSSGSAPASTASPSPQRQEPAANASPGAGSRPGAPVRNGTRGSARASSTGTASGPARTSRGERGSARAAAASAGRRPARSDGAPAAAPVRTSVIERIVDRIPAELLAALAVACLLAAAMSLVWLRERSKVRVAQREALVDPLTGIANRLAFHQRLAHEWKRSRRYGRPLGVLLLDLDGLKRVNDTRGHDAGDELIRAAAGRIVEDTRQSDLAARLAGDEFVVLCPETQRIGLQQLGSKLEQRLRQGGIEASIGWAELTDADVRPEDMVARADESMYRAKHSRRSSPGGATAAPGLAIAG